MKIEDHHNGILSDEDHHNEDHHNEDYHNEDHHNEDYHNEDHHNEDHILQHQAMNKLLQNKSHNQKHGEKIVYQRRYGLDRTQKLNYWKNI